MNHYSTNEINFFKLLLLEHNIRIDGREKMSMRKYDIQLDIVTTCFASLKLSYYNNSKKEILFAVKGEIKALSSLSSLQDAELITINIETMGKTDDSVLKAKSEIEALLNELMISKLSKESFIIPESNPQLVWKFYVDIYIFDDIQLSLFQLLAIGIRKVLKKIRLPKVITLYNEITKTNEYDLQSNYADLPDNQCEYLLKLSIPKVYCFSLINNTLYLDPTDEECYVANCIIFLSELNNEIIRVQSIGSNVDPSIMLDLGKIILNKIK